MPRRTHGLKADNPIAAGSFNPNEPAATARMNRASAEASEIDLVELFYYLLEHIWMIIAGAVVGALIAGMFSFYFVTPLYESTATLYVFKSKDSAVGVDVSGLSIASQLTSDYVQLFKLRTVNEEVIRTLQLPYSVGQLQGMLTISNPSNTRYLNISVRAADPDEARLIANAFGTQASIVIKEKMQTQEPTVLDEAITSLRPVTPNKSRNIMMGGLIGGFLIVGVFFLIFIMDDKIKSADDLTRFFGIPTLAIIPMVGAVSDIVAFKHPKVKRKTQHGR
jgi:capsular polysaccharide biosynthesis protein